jgi:hypothetical protein
MIPMKSAAKKLGIGQKLLYSVVKAGEIKYLQRKPHSKIFFLQEWLDEWQNNNIKQIAVGQPAIAHPNEIQKRCPQAAPVQNDDPEGFEFY